MSPMKTGQLQNKPFSRHHSLFAVRKAAYTPPSYGSRYTMYIQRTRFLHEYADTTQAVAVGEG